MIDIYKRKVTVTQMETRGRDDLKKELFQLNWRRIEKSARVKKQVVGKNGINQGRQVCRADKYKEPCTIEQEKVYLSKKTLKWFF